MDVEEPGMPVTISPRVTDRSQQRWLDDGGMASADPIAEVADHPLGGDGRRLIHSITRWRRR